MSDAMHPAERGEDMPVRPRVRPARLLPAVVIVTVTLAAVAALSVSDDEWGLVALVLLAPPLAAIAVVDYATHRIPATLTVVALTTAALSTGARAVATTSVELVVRGMGAAMVVGLLYLLLWRFADLGFGDVKLAASLALVAGWTEWQIVVLFLLLAHLLLCLPRCCGWCDVAETRSHSRRH